MSREHHQTGRATSSSLQPLRLSGGVVRPQQASRRRSRVCGSRPRPTSRVVTSSAFAGAGFRYPRLARALCIIRLCPTRARVAGGFTRRPTTSRVSAPSLIPSRSTLSVRRVSFARARGRATTFPAALPFLCRGFHPHRANCFRASMTTTATPNQALERTAPRVTPAAPPPSPAQPSRRAGQSLSLGSFGDISRVL